MKSRQEISKIIVQRLQRQKQQLQNQFEKSKNGIGFFFLDEVLPEELALEIHQNFPKTTQAVQKKNLRENKYVAYQMDKFHPLLEQVIYAFQDREVVDLIGQICGLKNIYPDNHLYAGGLSLMGKDNFLNPHLDNSHDKDRNRWRVLNLLYYLTPDWKLKNGGNLELWQNGIKDKPMTIESNFNRLVVMTTHQKSWHSVSKVIVNDVRCCVSNYYFSDTPLLVSDKFHVTTFRGRPAEKYKDFILQIDNKLRSTLRKVFRKGVKKNTHQYRKDNNQNT